MTDRTIDLDTRRGLMAQKATKLRRVLAEVAADEKALRSRHQALERQLLAAPAASWPEAAEKACYLLALFAAGPAAQDPRRQRLIASVIEDFCRLSQSMPSGHADAGSTQSETSDPTGENMAKGQKRSNREIKKPKSAKNTATAVPVAASQTKWKPPQQKAPGTKK